MKLCALGTDSAWKALVTKPYDSSLISWNHRVEGKNALLQVVLCFPHAHHALCSSAGPIYIRNTWTNLNIINLIKYILCPTIILRLFSLKLIYSMTRYWTKHRMSWVWSAVPGYKQVTLDIEETIQYHLWYLQALWPWHSQCAQQMNSTYHFSPINKLPTNKEDCFLLMKRHSRMGSWFSVL